MPNQLFRHEALAFQAERQWGGCTEISATRMAIITSLLTAILISILWFLFTGDYKRKTTVSGVLVPDKGAVQIRAPADGIVEVVHVGQSKRVGKGESLVLLQPGNTGMDGLSMANQLLEQNQLQQALVKEMITTEKESNRIRLRQQQQEISTLMQQKTELARLLNNEEYVSRILEGKKMRLQNLSEKDHVAIAEVDEVVLEILRHENSVHRLTIQQQTNLQDLQEAIGNKNLLGAEHYLKLANHENKLAELQKQYLELMAAIKADIVSPVDGTVASVNIQSGQSVVSKQTLVSVIQDDSLLEAELVIPSRAAGFVQPGLRVNIRLDAYPYQKFGQQSAFVKEISSVTQLPGDPGSKTSLNEPYYKASASIENQFIDAFGEQVPLKAGMKFTADIVLESRNLFEWLLEPAFMHLARK